MEANILIFLNGAAEQVIQPERESRGSLPRDLRYNHGSPRPVNSGVEFCNGSQPQNDVETSSSRTNRRERDDCIRLCAGTSRPSIETRH